MMFFYYIFVFILILSIICEQTATKKRKKRYLVYTKATQYGVYVTVSLPLESSSYVNVAWFFEASYYDVDNSTWFDPLLGDVYTVSKNRKDRSIEDEEPLSILTRKSIYIFIETMLEKHGYPGQPCLLRAICDNADSHFLHNGLMGDLLYFILTPSISMSENAIEDCYYEAEYYGLEKQCEYYYDECPMDPLEHISTQAINYD